MKTTKGAAILRHLINEAMEAQIKRSELQQREVEPEEEENAVGISLFEDMFLLIF